MRTRMLAAGAAILVGASLGAGLASAQQAEPVGGWTQRFVSPCGQPWRAGDGEPYPLLAWFNATDTNHDGAVDRDEFRADHAQWFDKLDQDHNGLLDGIEVAFYEKRLAPDVLLGQLVGSLDPALRAPGGLWGGQLIRTQLGGVLSGQPAGPPGAQGPPPDLGASRPQKQPLIGSALFGLLNDAEPVTSADANLDGRITKAEFLSAADRRFKRLDRNGDGKLTIDELPKPQAQVVAEAAQKKKAKKR